MIINYEAFQKLKLYHHPFDWGFSDKLIKPKYKEDLIKSFPSDTYLACTSHREDKSYSMQQRSIPRNEHERLQLLTPLWHNLINEILSKRYIDFLSILSGLDLKTNIIEINLWKYSAGNWLSPHTDKENKVFTQLFYFNKTWTEAWGGALRILNSSNEEDYYKQIFPGPCSSVFLKRCSNSWHAVSLQNSNESRNVLQIVFNKA